jgi:hypothetical protein
VGLKALGHSALSGLLQTVTVASGSAVSLAISGTSYNVTSKSLTAGTYLIWGTIDYSLSSATVTSFNSGLSASSATLPTQAGGSGVGTDPLSIMPISPGTTVSVVYTESVGPTTFTIAATTTLYLVANATYSAGSVSAYGSLWAMQINLS